MVRKRLEQMTERELYQLCRGLAELVEENLPDGPSNRGKALFVLLFTGSTGPGETQYVSNCHRSDMVAYLREAADVLEGKGDTQRDKGDE